MDVVLQNAAVSGKSKVLKFQVHIQQIKGTLRLKQFGITQQQFEQLLQLAKEWVEQRIKQILSPAKSTGCDVNPLRGSDFPADNGVLYTEQEKMRLNACIVQIANSKHNDMTDFGPNWLKTSISHILLAFLSGQCDGAGEA